MAKKREFGEGPAYLAANYIMWFFLANVYFLLCNIPLIFVLFSFSGEYINEYMVLLAISLLPVGPAYTALLSAMGKLVREKDVNITKDYFSAYKTNFFQSLFVWTLQVAIIAVLLVDAKFFAAGAYGKLMVPIVYVVILIILVCSIYIYSIISRFYLKAKDIIKLSLYYLVAKWKVTISTISVLILSYAITTKFASVASLFIFSLTCYAIMFFQKDILKELEEKLKANQPTEA